MAIAFDTTQHASGTNPSLSITRGTGASDYIGLAIVIPNGGTRTCSGATWDGVAMTQIYDVPDVLNGAGGRAYMFYIVNPPTGAVTVAATTTNSFQLEAVTFSGVDQSTPLDTNVDGAANSFVATNPTGVSNTSITGTTHVDNSELVGMMDWSAGTPSGGTNTTIPPATLTWMYSTTPVTPAGSNSLNISNGSSGNYSLTLIALQPSTGAASPQRDARKLTLLGVG